MDIRDYNRNAWNGLVAKGDKWTIPVDKPTVDKARKGELSVLLTPETPVPMAWFPPFKGLRVLGLAASGGQQSPLFAAAGAIVSVLDNSPSQLNQDRLVADREGLSLDLHEGDMRDLSIFKSETFDLIFHPVSNCFVPDVAPVWRECVRVLKPGGFLLAGIANPIIYSLDTTLEKQDILQLKYAIPYSDVTSLTDEERRQYTDHNEPLVFGHSLEQQLGGVLKAGMVLTDLFEDWQHDARISRLMKPFIAFRAMKPR